MGPKATPPPKRVGELSAPTRARPVPFWRQALAPVIATSPRVRVEAEPWRREARSARAASSTSEWWKGSPKSSFGRSAFVVLPSTAALAIGSCTSTTALREPGTEPLISSRLRSASTWATSRPFWVTRLLPIWPGILMPLKTRAGKVLAPIEPGARTLWEPWLTGPR